MPADSAADLGEFGIEFGVCIVVTNEAGALAEAPNLLALAKPWAKARFTIENQFHGAVDPAWLKKTADGARVASFVHQYLRTAPRNICRQAALR